MIIETVARRVVSTFFAVLAAISLPAWGNDSADALFGGLLEESGMMLTCNDGYVAVPPASNELLSYEKALRTEDGVMEIRFSIRPLARITIDYEDPHNAAPEPEHLFPLLFQSLTDDLSGGMHSPNREFTREQAQQLFNADWAAASTFDVIPEYKADYKHAFMVAMHGVGRADAYTVMLFNNYEMDKDAIQEGMSCLLFRAPDTGVTRTED